METGRVFRYALCMTEITNELIYEVLKKIQNDVSTVKQTLSDHTHALLRIREDVNNLRADDLRREGLQAQVDVRLGRIETRLGLHDA
jgi:hypothetical protein